MTIEEKAKAYDEALERAKKYNIDDAHAYQGTIVKLIFPELAKSEDEKIRKEMIRYFTEMKKGGSAALPYDDCIAYLERQKERKSVEWSKATINGEPIPTENQSVNIPLAEWSDDYNEDKLQTRFAFYTYKDEPSVLYLSNVFVEKACRTSGYGTRILKAAEKVAEVVGATTIRLKVKQESLANAWYRKNGYSFMTFEDGYNWLEKNIECIKPNKQEWSKEDENKIERLAFLVSVAEAKEMISPSESIDLRNLIKSLRPQSKKEFSMEKAIKWLDDTFYFLDNSSGRGRDCEITTHDFDSLEEMYDSFRKAVIVDSEPHWKPTEEQMGGIERSR